MAMVTVANPRNLVVAEAQQMLQLRATILTAATQKARARRAKAPRAAARAAPRAEKARVAKVAEVEVPEVVADGVAAARATTHSWNAGTAEAAGTAAQSAHPRSRGRKGKSPSRA